MRAIQNAMFASQGVAPNVVIECDHLAAIEGMVRSGLGLALMREVLGGAVGAARDIVLVNAAAALYVAGRAGDVRAGMALAAEAIDSGEAGRRLDALARRSQELAA